MTIIDGKILAQEIMADVAVRVRTLPFSPVFCDVLVGSDPVSASYVRIKAKSAEKCGIVFKEATFDESISTESLFQQIEGLNKEPHLGGLIVQLPLPKHIESKKIIDAIDPELDVDCLGSFNKNLFYSGAAVMVPPTAAAIMKILQSLPVDFAGKTIVVVGQGELVGKPITYLCKRRGYTVITADKATVQLSDVTLRGDIVISGTGVPGLITGSMIREGAIVIDAGTAESNGGIVGDIDYETVAPRCSYLSPVPGGVGPVTVAMLLDNVIRSLEKKLSTES